MGGVAALRSSTVAGSLDARARLFRHKHPSTTEAGAVRRIAPACFLIREPLSGVCRVPCSMARGPTAKCPFCKLSLSYAYVKVPRTGKVVATEGLHFCRNCSATVKRGRE